MEFSANQIAALVNGTVEGDGDILVRCLFSQIRNMHTSFTHRSLLSYWYHALLSSNNL